MWAASGSRAAARGVLATSRNAQVREAGGGPAGAGLQKKMTCIPGITEQAFEISRHGYRIHLDLREPFGSMHRLSTGDRRSRRFPSVRPTGHRRR